MYNYNINNVCIYIKLYIYIALISAYNFVQLKTEVKAKFLEFFIS